MNAIIVTPPGTRQTSGNQITADRWTAILRALRHRVVLQSEWTGDDCDALIALHALKSFASIKRFSHRHPQRPLVVALTGTDLYNDLYSSAEARRSLALASAVIVLQKRGLDELEDRIRAKAHVIYQSAGPVPRHSERSGKYFTVSVLSHLRAVKDPLRAAQASRLLPATSNIKIVHAGAAIEEGWEEAARKERELNPRYEWRGELAHAAAVGLLAESDLVVVSSLLEGGASVIAEAVVAGVPVIASAVPGNIGMMGEGYPGYFPARETARLADLLRRAETDASFLEELRRWIVRLQPQFSVERETESWKALLQQLRM